MVKKRWVRNWEIINVALFRVKQPSSQFHEQQTTTTFRRIW